MTLSEMRTLYWDYLDDPSGGYFTQSVANTRLNLAARELQKRLLNANKQYYATCVKTNTVVDQAKYALPSDFMQIVSLSIVLSGSGDTATKQAIQEVSPNSSEALNAPVSGDPMFYYFQKNYIVLKPAPDRIVELHLDYSYLIADMAGDADEPDIPEQYHEYIPALAAETGFLKDGRPLAPIDKKLKDLEQLITSIAKQRNIDRPRMIVSTDGGFGSF